MKNVETVKTDAGTFRLHDGYAKSAESDKTPMAKELKKSPGDTTHSLKNAGDAA